ncbi:reverse transcriptase domain-containing protein [Tanacetum coccineum]|uniref:Reverse transcriptase domain-containing protein n=1 Tax=Tanacetum coccineum TaxID=301880 RepID=A0ABQ5BMJ9_9ASTR
MPTNVKTYDGSRDPEDHLKIFQTTSKVECWAIPTWCHMFNSTLIGSARLWFDELPPESIDSYIELQKAFLANFLQQKNYIKDPVEIHHIKQREGESTEDFMERFKAKSKDVKGAPEARWAWQTNPGIRVRQHGDIMKGLASQDLTKGQTSKLVDTVKFKAPPPMFGSAVNQNKNKFYEFHGDKGHGTDESIYLKKLIEEAVKSGLRKIQAVPSTSHGMLKFLVQEGIVTLHSSTIVPTECRMVAEAPTKLPPNEPTKEKGVKVAIHPESNLDVFAWKPADMMGVLRSIAEHRLNVHERCPPIRRNKRGQAPNRNKSIQEEVAKLKSDFKWTAEAKKTFQEMKQHIAELPTLTDPKPREELIMYLCAARPDNDTPPTEIPTEEELPEPSTLLTDGSSCLEGSGARLILTNPEGMEFTYALIFEFFSIEQVLRSENTKADALSKIASTSFAHLTKQVLVDILKENSINEKEIFAIVEEKGHTWMTLLLKYLIDEPWLRCVGLLQSEYVVREIYKGSCSMHSGPRYVVAKAISSEYYWPKMHKDARSTIQICDDFQGIYISSPFPEAQGKVNFLIVAIDYFTKWIEAKPVIMITGNQIKKIIWDNIVCMFSLPGKIVSQNKKQFRDNPFKDWYDKHNIKQRFASVKHPQTNGLVERANRSLKKGIKASSDQGSKKLVEEVPHVLWVHRTMIKTSNGDTSFSLTYDTEAVILVEIRMPSLRCAEVGQVLNDKALLLNLDILEEKWERAAIRKAKSKEKMEKYYHAKVRGITFKPRDFIYYSNESSHTKEGGKLGPKWEGPYEVVETLGKRAYKIHNGNGDILLHTWNAQDLKKCYL